MGLRTQLMWIQRMERPGGSGNSGVVRKVLHGAVLEKGLPTKSCVGCLMNVLPMGGGQGENGECYHVKPLFGEKSVLPTGR
eukprot:1614647-Rhodomonas_salina.1